MSRVWPGRSKTLACLGSLVAALIRGFFSLGGAEFVPLVAGSLRLVGAALGAVDKVRGTDNEEANNHANLVLGAACAAQEGRRRRYPTLCPASNNFATQFPSIDADQTNFVVQCGSVVLVLLFGKYLLKMQEWSRVRVHELFGSCNPSRGGWVTDSPATEPVGERKTCSTVVISWPHV